MNRLLLYLVIISAALIGLGALYYLCLAIHLPFWIFLLLAALLLYGCYRLFKKLAISDKEFRIELVPALMMLGATTCLMWASSGFYQPYGEWDALSMWNYHARFLSEPAHWQRVYHTGSFDHPDYPHGLPAAIAICWRILRNASPLVPLIISWWVMIALPLMICCALGRQRLIIAAAILLYFCTSQSYLQKGISGYADTLLSLLFLGTLIAADKYQVTGNKAWMLLCGACAGTAVWTKNEGLLLVTIFILFHARLFFKRGIAVAFITGAALPLAAFAVHKIAYAPGNDLADNMQLSTLLAEGKDRLATIMAFFRGLMWESFRPIVFIIAAYAVWCIIRRRWPSKAFLVVLACLCAYIGVYLVTPYSLEWHLSTSMDRLIHQLIPPALYAIGMQVRRPILSEYRTQQNILAE